MPGISGAAVAAGLDRRRQQPLDRMEQELVHAAAVAETDFGLGRMHVDVDAVRRQADEQAIRRVQLVMQHVAVGFLQRVDDQLVAHVAAVDEDVLAVAAGRGGAGADHPAGLTRNAPPAASTAIVLDSNASPSTWRTRAWAGSAFSRSCTRPLWLSVNATCGLRQRQSPHGFGAVRVFGGLGLEKLAPRRGVEKQILDVERGADARAAGAGSPSGRLRPAASRRARRRCDQSWRCDC